MKKILVLLILLFGLLILLFGCRRPIIQPRSPRPEWLKKGEIFKKEGTIYSVGMSKKADISEAIAQAKKQLRSFLEIKGKLFTSIKDFYQDPETGICYALVWCHDTSARKD